MGSIIDRFGPEVQTEVVDRAHFKVTAAVALSSNFYGWVFASGGKMKILSPEKAVIVMSLHEHTSTLKRLGYHSEQGRYLLVPENDQMEPIVVDHVDVQGVAKFVIKAL